MKKGWIVAIGLLLLLIAVTTIYITQWRVRNDISSEVQDSLSMSKLSPPPPPQPMLYGFVEDSFTIEKFRVKRNQNLAEILLHENIEYSAVNLLAENCKEFFDVRRIRYGNPYTIFYEKDSLSTPLWMVYEIDNTDYLVMQLKDSMKVTRKKKKITLERKSSVGLITSSLWKTIQDNNLSPMLANDLSDIYAWTVDFFGIEKGDHFKVIYDEAYVDSTSIGVENIYAAYFYHKGRPYYAFKYQQDSVWSFFDEQGLSLRKAFLKAPLKFSRISSRFSNNRFHPVLKINRPHHGVDYAAPSGTPVYAIGDGSVLKRGWDAKGGGNYIKIRHNSVYTTVYMHLSGFAKGLRQGGFVRQGELIGYVGKTGLATGPHLDFRVFKNGRPVDPLKIEAPPVDPIDSTSIDHYLEFVEPWISELDNLQISNLHPEEDAAEEISRSAMTQLH